MASDNDIAIKVSGLHKSFRLPTERAWGLKQAIFNRLRGVKGYKEQKVLRGLDFEIKKGEFVGIVGRNGSGKSTLLKILAGIYRPEKGSVTVNGSLVPFIELGVGFNPELTGRENIYMNGALLGFSNKEVDEMYDEIVDFAELREFMDQKLKNYSSGMQVRLAFSIAIRADSDILLLDEVLAVGDEAFQRKCFAYFAKLKKAKKTVILVTHSMASVQQFCNRAIMIDSGKIIAEGNTRKVSQKYRDLNMEEDDPGRVTMKKGRGDSKYLSIKANAKVNTKKVTLDFQMEPKEKIEDPAMVVVVYREDGTPVYRWASDEKLDGELDLSQKNELHIELDNFFPDGDFSVTAAFASRDRSTDYGVFNDVMSFRVDPRNSYPQDVLWKIPEKFDLK
ncbi:ATP-binding cassette domain-containing protein [Candidatus Saccharibacteria bacterium]|nr:ATP-binding cassette domain-containing protein [Candidatus Saccharibacteria bacterium]